MDRFEDHAFIDFAIADETSLHRLAAVIVEFRTQKVSEATREGAYWLNYFTDPDRAEFWWPSKVEIELWNKFWCSTPAPVRNSAKMPLPPWDVSSMIDSILDGEFDLIGVRGAALGRARLEIQPHGYPYGGVSALRALVRSFGHTITGFDDGAGYTDGDPEAPRWSPDLPADNLERPSFFERFKRR